MERSGAAIRLIQWADDEEQQHCPDFKMQPELFNQLLDLLVEYDHLRSVIDSLRRENKGLRVTIDSDAVGTYVHKLENANQELLNEIATLKHNLQQRDYSIDSLIEQSSAKEKTITTLLGACDNYLAANNALRDVVAVLQKRNDRQAETIKGFQRETGRWGDGGKDEVITELRNLALTMGIEAGEKDLVILDLEKRLEQADKLQVQIEVDVPDWFRDQLDRMEKDCNYLVTMIKGAVMVAET